MMGSILSRCLHALIVFSLLNVPSRGDTLPVFGTGVDGSNNLLPGGINDPHYTVSGPGTSDNFIPAVVYSSPNGFPQWVPDDAHSGWIGWVDNAFPDHYGTYNYRTTFDLTGHDPSTAVLTGQWAADQFGSILLNGHSTGVSVPDGNWNSAVDPNLTSFTINSGFVSGINTLDFIVSMPDGFDGLRVRNLVVTAQAVPEPASVVVLGTGAISISMLGYVRRRRAAKAKRA